MSKTAPELWTDFDGTAVRKHGLIHPRNMAKYRLLGIPGYVDFLEGVKNTGVEIAGAVTARKEWARRFVTNHSIKKLGYSGTIKPERVVYAGSEEAKGRFVAEQSQRTTIGMLEDKPHKLGAALLDVLTGAEQQPELPHNPILLGVVNHDKSQRYIKELAKRASRIASNDISVAWTGPMTASGLSIEGKGLSLQVVQLEPFSIFSGEKFGHQLLELAAK